MSTTTPIESLLSESTTHIYSKNMNRGVHIRMRYNGFKELLDLELYKDDTFDQYIGHNLIRLNKNVFKVRVVEDDEGLYVASDVDDDSYLFFACDSVHLFVS